MVIGSATDDVVIFFNKSFGHSLCILLNLLCVLRIIVTQYFTECNGFCGDHMLQWAALNSGKYSHIKQIAHHANVAFHIFQSEWIFKVFAHQNNSTTGTTQSFVCGGCNNMTMLKWRVQQTFCNQPCRVCNISHYKGS